MGKLIFITGGARSGKSTFAEKTAKEATEKVTYIATSIAFDDGMLHRIKKHREQRPSSWGTIETYKDFDKVSELKEYMAGDLLLVDCLTIMVTNHMIYSGLDFDTCTPEEVDELEKDIRVQVDKLLDLTKDKDMILVSNELGMGLVPAYKMGSYFRDIAGRMNQLAASRADEVYLVVSGIEIKIK
ncbi:MAG: bifunctional adenosylcobinamide kinase/adenosylcobinamide-phosphate guanylyltransferase [Eubacteriaceae bacterium]|nr:bifunctional adenosylcobinamide kinase/adenosylcobinamide-phosphate guanylyltransferase [Eubacteriaceae bacterium]